MGFDCTRRTASCSHASSLHRSADARDTTTRTNHDRFGEDASISNCCGIATFPGAVPTDAKAVKYRRSSIYMMMLDDHGLVNADLIKNTFGVMHVKSEIVDFIIAHI